MSMTALVFLASEPSKTPFYVGGGVLAAWAVLLAVAGLTQPEFPRSDGAARGIYGVSAVLMVAAVVSAIATK